MSDANPIVVLETSKGDITLELDAARAPITTQNFLEYVESNFFKNTIFHRVIPGFMIQGGGMLFNMKEKLAMAPIKNEAGNGLKNKRGTIAMARTSVVDSASCQFFINLSDGNAFLDHKDNSSQGFGYAVFGKVTDGMDVVDAIAAVKTGRQGGHDDVPVDPITIKAAARIE